MLARTTLRLGARARHMAMSAKAQAYLGGLEAQEAAAKALASQLPAEFAHFAGDSSRSEAFKSAAEKFPELTETMVLKIEEADAPGIRATVTAPKDPVLCKYTEEGTLVHELIKSSEKMARREMYVAPFEYAMPEADIAAEMARIEKEMAGVKDKVLSTKVGEFGETIDAGIARVSAMEVPTADLSAEEIAWVSSKKAALLANYEKMKGMLPAHKKMGEAAWDADVAKAIKDCAPPAKFRIL